MALAPGTKIGPYEILSPLGAGGMGEVYRARDSRLGRDVAIKVLPAALARDVERLRRFETEARAVAALNHPNILSIHDIGTHEGAPYLVSECLEGKSLRMELSGSALPVRSAVEYGTDIAQGLAAAHDKGIIHRDLKPENIFVTRDGRVKILDFGIAKLVRPETTPDEGATLDAGLTSEGVVMGTAAYMSPEQVKGEPADARSDIFALGAVLYEMLSGQRAFRRGTSAETMTAILREDPPELTLSGKPITPVMERIVRRSWKKSRCSAFSRRAIWHSILKASQEFLPPAAR
jgi:serine/threonine protein kinase